MPFRSGKQRKFLWMKHPEIARRWTNEHGSTPRKNAVKRRVARKRNSE
jgi:hypothetical protein